MESLTSIQHLSKNKTQISEDELAEQKKIIAGLIPTLLNDKGSEPRTYNKDNVQELFMILIMNNSDSLCKYAENKIFNYFYDDEFALECGLTTVCHTLCVEIFGYGKARHPLSYFVRLFECAFDLAIQRDAIRWRQELEKNVSNEL